MKVIRCKDCALDGNPECPLSYIEKQTLCFVEHSPMFFCGKAKPTEDYQPTNGDVIRNMTDRQLAEWLTELKELRNSLGAVKLSNMKEARELIRDYKVENITQEKLIAEYKRLLKAAVDDLNFESQCRNCKHKEYGLNTVCKECRGNKYEWRYADEFKKMIGEEGEK